jgi:hypothetical protein
MTSTLKESVQKRRAGLVGSHKRIDVTSHRYRYQRQFDRDESPLIVEEIGPEPPINKKGFWSKPDPHVIKDQHRKTKRR